MVEAEGIGYKVARCVQHSKTEKNHLHKPGVPTGYEPNGQDNQQKAHTGDISSHKGFAGTRVLTITCCRSRPKFASPRKEIGD